MSKQHAKALLDALQALQNAISHNPNIKREPVIAISFSTQHEAYMMLVELRKAFYDTTFFPPAPEFLTKLDTIFEVFGMPIMISTTEPPAVHTSKSPGYYHGTTIDFAFLDGPVTPPSKLNAAFDAQFKKALVPDLFDPATVSSNVVEAATESTLTVRKLTKAIKRMEAKYGTGSLIAKTAKLKLNKLKKQRKATKGLTKTKGKWRTIPLNIPPKPEDIPF